MSEPLLYTVDEAASTLRISRSNLYKLIDSGQIPIVKIGRSTRITRQALEQFIGGLPDQ